MPPELAEVRSWLEKAGHDRWAVETFLKDPHAPTDVAAFHCQQAVEKLLKAYLVYRRHAFEKTHDLVELVAQCAGHDPGFAALQPQVEPLSPYAVRFRYPGPTDPPPERVREALRVVHEVWTFVLARVPPDARPEQ
jgi:HEPN domain-containing protein